MPDMHPTAAAPFSAQVVLQPSAAAAHAPAHIQRVQQAFSALGFKAGPFVGNSFAIEADADVFRATFGAALARRADGGVAVDGSTPAAQGLLLRKLSASLQPLVAAVVFSEPPAFGPGAP